jgi:hypothetical protein
MQLLGTHALYLWCAVAAVHKRDGGHRYRAGGRGGAAAARLAGGTAPKHTSAVSTACNYTYQRHTHCLRSTRRLIQAPRIIHMLVPSFTHLHVQMGTRRVHTPGTPLLPHFNWVIAIFLPIIWGKILEGCPFNSVGK